MAHLLIANGTHQHLEFQHRVPEFGQVFSTLVPAGRQVRHPVDMNEHQLKVVLEQLERFGARPVSEAGEIDTPHGLVFSVGKPIPSARIDAAREKDESIRQEIADTQIENAGVAIPATGEAGQHLRRSTLEIKELQPTQREELAKGGVDTTIEVSKLAGRKQRTKG